MKLFMIIIKIKIFDILLEFKPKRPGKIRGPYKKYSF